MSDRTPPHDERAEQVLLGLALVRPTTLDEIGDLNVDDFFIPAHREIFEAMLDLVRRGRRVEIVGLVGLLRTSGKLSRLPEGAQYIDVCTNAVEIGDARHFARVVAEKAILRRMIHACAEIASACYGDVADVSELVADARQKLTKIELSGDQDGPVKLADDLDSVISDIEKRASEPAAHFVLSHIEAFDRMIGGFGAGQLVVVAANPSRGKTAFGLNLILRSSRNAHIPSLIFSLEMSRSELVERALAFDGRINGQSVVSGKMNGPEWMRIQSAGARLHRDPVWVDARMLTAPRICSEARRWRAQNPSKQALIAIDYLGLIRRLGGVKDAFAEISEMPKLFKTLAKELKCPVVLIAQLNRENVKENRKPRPSDLRGSGEIEADADMILFPWWEGDAPIVGTHPAWLIVAKNRKGPRGEVPVTWSPEYMSFEDREDLDQPQQASLVT